MSPTWKTALWQQFGAAIWPDLYLSDSAEGFAPPAPFTLDELDPAGILPERVHEKHELLAYLAHCRETVIAALTEETAPERRTRGSFDGSLLEGLLYHLRHVQHHTGQLNLILRRETGLEAPRWVARAQGALP